MRHLAIVGIGAGDPSYVTVQAIEVLNRTDVLFFFDKGDDKEDLLALRHQICERHIAHDRYRIVEVQDAARDLSGPQYGEAVSEWQDERVSIWEHLLATELADGERGAVLTWGDPAVYDGTLRIVDTLQRRGLVTFSYEVVPGISAMQVLAARHRITLTQTGGTVALTTGRQLSTVWSSGVTDVIVMLDTRCAFDAIEDKETLIFWGAYLGTPDECLIAGTIATCAEHIKRVRAEARARKGWMFDTYLLRRHT
jgi:precorrin-6A synthase